MREHTSFMEVQNGRVMDYWKVPPIVGDASESAIGRCYCAQLLEVMRERQAPYLLGWVMKEMASKGEFGAVEIGFCQALAESSLGMRLNTEPPKGIIYDDVIVQPTAAVRAAPIEPTARKPQPKQVLSAEDEASRLMRMPEVTRLLGISRPTLYRLIQTGEFPSPIKQGRTSAWRRSSVLSYLANREGDRL